MSYQDPDKKFDFGNMLAGLFLSCFGLFGVLLGGGCGIMLIPAISGTGSGGMGFLIVVALAILAGGGVALWQGIKLLIGRD